MLWRNRVWRHALLQPLILSVFFLSSRQDNVGFALTRSPGPVSPPTHYNCDSTVFSKETSPLTQDVIISFIKGDPPPHLRRLSSYLSLKQTPTYSGCLHIFLDPLLSDRLSAARLSLSLFWFGSHFYSASSILAELSEEMQTPPFYDIYLLQTRYLHQDALSASRRASCIKTRYLHQDAPLWFGFYLLSYFLLALPRVQDFHLLCPNQS